MKKVSIITVNYNQPELTELLLDSIFNTNTYFALEIIVVDNGSQIDPLPGWKRKYPAVNFIASEKNLGFAGGNNLGIKEALGDYLFFVNNDTEFTDDLVDKLVEILDNHPEVGIVSPKIRYFSDPQVLQYAGFTRMNYYTGRNQCIGNKEKDNGQYDNLTGETGYPHGAAMMVRKDALKKVGGMPELFFLYYEEIDWCDQIRRAGFTTWVNMQALIYHKESMTVGSDSPLKEYFMNRNRILYLRRNAPVQVRLIFWPYFVFIVTPRNIIGYIRKGQWGFIPILLRAIIWNLVNSDNSINLGYEIPDGRKQINNS